MISSISLIFINAVIAMLTAFTELRHATNKNITLWGATVIALAMLGVCLSSWVTWEETTEKKIAPFLLRDSDIQIQLDAFIVNEFNSEDLQSKTPSTIKSSLMVSNEGGWEFILEPLPGFVSSGYSRGGHNPKRIYLSKSVVKTQNNAFKYLWDLEGKEVLVLRNPKYLFSSINSNDVVKDWKIDMTLRIQGKEFKPIDADALTLRFPLNGIDQDTLVK